MRGGNRIAPRKTRSLQRVSRLVRLQAMILSALARCIKGTIVWGLRTGLFGIAPAMIGLRVTWRLRRRVAGLFAIRRSRSTLTDHNSASSVPEERLTAAHLRIAQLNCVKINHVVSKPALLSLFAVLRAPETAAKFLASLLFMSAFLSAVLALHSRARLKSSVLSYWDETAFFLLCALIVRSMTVSHAI
jgi:hypothetical protein